MPHDLLEPALGQAVAAFTQAQPAGPLAEAMAYALFSGGARLRPQLALALAAAAPGGVDRVLPVACALELLHTASLVHDDLPCFDDAATRRNRPCVHRVYGEATAVLVGDALLTLAFRVVGDLAAAPCAYGQAAVARAATALMHGQAHEQQAASPADLAGYHYAKTGCLFEAAAAAGAWASGGDKARWAAFGRDVGAAYQLADDLLDLQDGAATGKTGGRDAALQRPNFALQHGEKAALRALARRLQALQRQAAVPPAPLQAWLAPLLARLTAQLPKLAHVGAGARPVAVAAGSAAAAGRLAQAAQAP